MEFATSGGDTAPFDALKICAVRNQPLDRAPRRGSLAVIDSRARPTEDDQRALDRHEHCGTGRRARPPDLDEVGDARGAATADV